MGQVVAFLDGPSRAWLGWMLPMFWQVCILVALVFCISLAARKGSARFRYLLWSLVLLKLCLPPSLSFVTGIGHWLPVAPPAPVEARFEAVPVLPVPVVAAEPHAESAVAAGVSPRATGPAATPSIHLSWAQALFVTWIAGMLVMLGFLCWQYVRMRRRLSGAELVKDRRILNGLDRARDALRIRSTVRLYASASLSSPILFGLLRPRIVLPSGAIDNLPDEEIEPILLHELAHYRRRDLWVNWIQVILQTIYWFHPLVWLADLRLRRERELIVDDIVLSQLQGRSEVYGNSLLSVVREAARRRLLAPGYVGIIETKGSLARRLRRILDANRRLSVRLGWVSAIALVVLALVLIPQAGSEPETPAGPAAQSRPPVKEAISRRIRFEQKFAEWEAEVQRKLEGESSSSIVSDDFTKYLAAHAHEHESYLLRKLEQNMFVVNILNKSDTLRRKYSNPSKSAGSKRASKAAWLKAMTESHNKRMTAPFVPTAGGPFDAGTAQLGDVATGQYEIGHAVKPVKVDGKLDPGEWNSAQEIAPVQITSGAGAESTSIRMMYDKDFLYLGVRCTDSQITERHDDFRKNDSIQARIRMGVVKTDDSFRFRLSAMPQGLVSARFHKGRPPLMKELIDFTKPLAPNLYKAACTVDDTGWSMEFVLSWSAIRPLPTPPAPFHVFVERRNINGNTIEVADWPYDKKVEFQFERPTDNKDSDAVIEAKLDKKISVNFSETAIGEIAPLLADVIGCSFVVDPEAAKKSVTLQVKNTKGSTLLKLMTKKAKMSFSVLRGAVYVAPKGEVAKAKAPSPLDKIAEKEWQKALEQSVSLDFAKAPLKDVTSFLSDLTGINLVSTLDEEAEETATVTLKVRDMQCRHVLFWLAATSRTQIEIEDNVIAFGTRDDE